MLNLCYIYYLSKLSEFADTIFFVLRKKKSQITWLHLYHHSLTPIEAFILVRFLAGNETVQSCCENICSCFPFNYLSKLYQLVQLIYGLGLYQMRKCPSQPFAHWWRTDWTVGITIIWLRPESDLSSISTDEIFVYLSGGNATFPNILNNFVHVCMYFYYMVSAMGPQYQKYLWWKKYMTELQIVSIIVW